MRIRTLLRIMPLAALSLALAAPAQAQDNVLDTVASIEVTPNALTLEVGQSAQLSAVVKDKDGVVVAAPVIWTAGSRRNLAVDSSGQVQAYRPGRFNVVAMVPRPENAEGGNQNAVRVEIPVVIPNPPLERIDVAGVGARAYAGTNSRITTSVVDITQTIRRDLTPGFTSSNPAVATVDRFGNFRALQPGSVTVVADIENVRKEVVVNVVANPVRSLDLNSSHAEARTGDVIQFTTEARDERGGPVAGVPVLYAVQQHAVATNPGAAATAQIDAGGRFVAEDPGLYTIIATSGSHSRTSTVEITPRNVQKRVELVGHAPVRDRHTSDLWIWEGTDGRDYGITGTWGADGHAYFWDVTDPKSMKLIDTVRVDARTINDVKISEDGRIAVISREGASDRRNGIVLLDVSKPQEGVTVLSRFDEGLTGGVHNVFIHKNHVYAVNNGRKYDIINISEPKIPYRVSEFELETPGHSIHDVWVVDGIAYSSNWADGVQLVDVGNGVAGGTPEKPVKFAGYADPGGRNHAAFPFKSQSTGKFYVVMGDEVFPFGLNSQNVPSQAGGYMHIVDFTDAQNPVEVARYEVPEAGTHNLWIENDVMYIGYYNGGVRMVDVSGELMGNLYKQGREIGWFRPFDPDGYIKNAPFVWGAQPYKGHIFFSDWNSGLWAVKLVDEEGGSQR